MFSIILYLVPFRQGLSLSLRHLFFGKVDKPTSLRDPSVSTSAKVTGMHRQHKAFTWMLDAGNQNPAIMH